MKTAFEDGMFVSKLREGPFNCVWLDYTVATFKDMAYGNLMYIIHSSERHGDVIEMHVAYDRYNDGSTKSFTRENELEENRDQSTISSLM